MYVKNDELHWSDVRVGDLLVNRIDAELVYDIVVHPGYSVYRTVTSSGVLDSYTMLHSTPLWTRIVKKPTNE